MSRRPVLTLLVLVLAAFMAAAAFAQGSQQLVALKAGFNFVAFTVAGVPAPADLKAQNPAIEEIYSYSAAAGSFLSLGEGTLSSLAPGRGYIIRAGAPATITVAGSPLGAINNITLRQGFNLTGFSKMPETITAGQLMEKFNVIGGIYSWSASAGSFVSVIRNGGLIDRPEAIDPSLAAGKAYFINAATETTMNYDGANITIGGGTVNPPAAKVATPEITPDGGDIVGSVKVTITCATAGASIRYTTDGTAPTATAGTVYAGPFELTSAALVRAVAYKEGMTVSDIARASFGTLDRVANPVVTPNGGPFTGSVEVSIACQTYGAEIYYMTVDGTFDLSSATVYTGPFTITTGTKVRVMAKREKMANSEIVTVTFTENAAPNAVADPVIAPNGGDYSKAQDVTMTCATEGATIKYTLDGSDPETNGLVYSEKISIADSKTVKAIAIKDGMTKSSVVTAKFTVTILPPNPAIQDVNIASYNKKALIALNVSGESQGEPEAIGAVPNTVAANAPIARMTFDPNHKPAYFDRQTKPFMAPGPGRAPGKIDHTDTNYTFKVSMNDAQVDTPATLKYGTETSKCLLYLANNVTVPATFNWQGVGEKFDNEIYTKTVGAFGPPTDIDGNGKVVILYYDLGAKEMNTVGYFFSVDLTPGRGNDMEIFYMNIKWGVEAGSSEFADPLSDTLIGTLTHEFEHLINHGQRVIIQKKPSMDAWMDEGLASSASYYINTNNKSSIDTFKSDSNNIIRNGAPLSVWNGKFEDYAQTFAFIQYCKNQAPEREKIFKKFIDNEFGDYRAIMNVMKEQNNLFTDFASILVGFRVANLVNGDGIYGYGQEKAVFDYNTAIYPPASTQDIKLAPGGAVNIFPADADFAAFAPAQDKGANIRFIRVSK